MKPRVLIAWFDPDFLRDARQLLEPMDYEVITIQDGGETLNYLRAHKVDVLMMGIMMATMDAFEIIEALRCERLMPLQRVILFVPRAADGSSKRMRIISGCPFAFWKRYPEMEVLPDNFDWDQAGILMWGTILSQPLRPAIEHILQLPQEGG